MGGVRDSSRLVVNSRAVCLRNRNFLGESILIWFGVVFFLGDSFIRAGCFHARTSYYEKVLTFDPTKSMEYGKSIGRISSTAWIKLILDLLWKA